MVRVTYGAPRRQKKTRHFKEARGFRGGRSKLWRTVQESLVRAWAYSTADRRRKKRTSAACGSCASTAAARQRGLSYSQLIAGLKKAEIGLNRKELAELAIHDPAAFDRVVETARAARA